MLKLRPVSGCVSDECPEEESEVLVGIFIRFLRRHNEKKINDIADKCLMCDKCHALCPVGVDAPALRRAQRATVNDSLCYDYSYLQNRVPAPEANDIVNVATGVSDAPEANDVVNVATGVSDAPEVMYFAGCMTHLTPRIIKSVEKVFKAASVNYILPTVTAASVAAVLSCWPARLLLHVKPSLPTAR